MYGDRVDSGLLEGGRDGWIESERDGKKKEMPRVWSRWNFWRKMALMYNYRLAKIYKTQWKRKYRTFLRNTHH